tara:strand:- start:1286 stop:1546 length:261 start_codon:yes stop_codon:yes gene_type:complete
MGINLKNQSWAPVVAANKQHMKPCPCMSAPGTFCLVHGREHTGMDLSNIRSTPAMDKYLAQCRRLGSSAQGQKFKKGIDKDLLPPA